MIDTVKSLLESAATPQLDFMSKNTAALNILDTITEASRISTAYIPQKVIVSKSMDNGYLVEYSNNLERLMIDQDMGIVEAMQVVAEVNEISLEECTVVFDESCINKIDIDRVNKLDPEFKLARK